MILPLGPITSPILSTGILIVVTRGAYGLISSGVVDGLGHDLEDRQPRVVGLVERARQHLRRDAVELGVQLQRGDEVLGAGALEVHVAERVLGAEDVGERRRSGARSRLRPPRRRRTPGPSRCRRPAPCSGTPAFSSDSVDAHTEPIEVEPLELKRLGDLADGVRELLDAGQHRHQRPLGQRAVADLAPLGRADPAGLAGGERREVVVVHVALGGLRAPASRSAGPS